MRHIKLKPTKFIKVDFDIAESVKNIEIPIESKKSIENYLKTDILTDEKDIYMSNNDGISSCFDYVYKRNKLMIQEINPSLIFYSNAQMFLKQIYPLKRNLLENSPYITKLGEFKNLDYNNNDFSVFFQFASNYIINLQATVESFMNSLIPDNYIHYNDRNKVVKFHNINFDTKMETIIPNLKGKSFILDFEKKYFLILKIKSLRNSLIHLKPNYDDKSAIKYKNLYREIIDFEYNEAIFSVRDYLNYYIPNLVEECECGKEFFYEINGNETKFK